MHMMLSSISFLLLALLLVSILSDGGMVTTAFTMRPLPPWSSLVSSSSPRHSFHAPTNRAEYARREKQNQQKRHQQQPSRLLASYSDSRTNTLQQQRRPVMAGNWKLQPATLAEATNLLKLLHSNFVNHRSSSSSSSVDDMNVEPPEVIVFPPFPFLQEAIRVLDGSGIQVGAQNVDLETEGAHTGQVAASMIRSLGCDYVLIGHSERRTLYDETNEDINKKVHLCLKQPGLNVILCIGETLEEYESDLLQSVVDVQIKKGLKDVSVQDITDQRIIIAYEPVWAIGTGKVATPLEAQEAHVVVRRSLASLYGHDVAATVRIQYGGSVKPDNVESLLVMPDVDGALVGGASLTADSFTRIVDGTTAAAAVVANSLTIRRPKEFTARECVPTKNVLGESAVWSARDEALYWIDAPLGEVWTWDRKNPAYRRIVGTTLGCVALKQSKTRGSLVLAGENAFLEMVMSATTTDFATGPKILCERPEQTDITRPNDGRVDRQGRFVFGMYNNYHRSPVGECNVAGIYRLNERCEVESILNDETLRYRVSNCISFSPDGDSMYFCDTPTRKIYAFDYGDNGLSNRRLIWTMPSNLNGGPDGAQADAQGFLWAALSGAGRVVRIDPRSGVVDMVVHLPVSSPTSCTFGGEDLSELFITTRGPDGGGIYSLKLPFGIRGLPEPEFKVTARRPPKGPRTPDVVPPLIL